MNAAIRQRSLLSVPAVRPALFEKAAAGAADVIMLDLEDSTPIDRKVAARADVCAGVQSVDWGDKRVVVRINALDTPFALRDALTVVEGAGPRLDALMLPKADGAEDIRFLHTLLDQLETEQQRDRPIAIEAQIESAKGLEAVSAIAKASPRLTALHYGPGDFAASIGARTVEIGGQHPDYGVLGGGEPRGFHPGDMWHYAHAKLITACRAAGIAPLDGPYAAYDDAAGLQAAAARFAAMGGEGKWAIHPKQIEAINAAFTPTQDEAAAARRVLGGLAAAQAEGRSAATVDGRMIDEASIRQARRLLARLDD